MQRTACQTIVFGDMNATDFGGMLKTIKEIGYNGVEIGIRRLDPAKAAEYKELLVANGLKLLALHIGGDFLDPESVKKQMESMPESIKLAHDLDCKFMFLSGKKMDGKTVNDYIQEGKNYNELGKMLRENGLTLCYHNHNWEIVDDLAGFRALMENTTPENMSLVPDLGWVKRAGVDPVEFLKTYGGRVRHVHFKDFTADGNFTELGTGIVDWKPVYDHVKATLGDACWIVAEQDKTELGAAESAKRNFELIQSIAG